MKIAKFLMFRIFLDTGSNLYSFKIISNQQWVRYGDSSSFLKKYNSSKCKQSVCLHCDWTSPLIFLAVSQKLYTRIRITENFIFLVTLHTISYPYFELKNIFIPINFAYKKNIKAELSQYQEQLYHNGTKQYI